MNGKQLMPNVFVLLALALAAGGSAAAAPSAPELCDQALCGPPPPPPPPPPAPPSPLPVPSYLPHGWLDTVSADGIAYGWACDPNDFSVPLDIHFYVDGPSGAGGTYVGSVVANVAREPGVANACGGNASHGFAFSLPASLWTGTARTLYAYAINIGPAASNPLLSGSPQWFTLQNLYAELWAEAYSATSSEFAYAGGVRCKRYEFTQHFTQAGLYRVLRYEGYFRVCYRYNNGIVSVSYRAGDAYWTCCGWEWRGNETGYPRHTQEAKKATFYFRGKMAICFLRIGCGPQRFPWVTVTFFDNNTVARSSGVA